MGKTGKWKSSTPTKSAGGGRTPDAELLACPFCGHPADGVECRIDLDLGVVEAWCGVCGNGYVPAAWSNVGVASRPPGPPASPGLLLRLQRQRRRRMVSFRRSWVQQI